MTQVRARFVESGGVRLAVREQGPPGAPTVVLVHGYPDNSALWDGVVEQLAGRFHVVRYDVRGAGRSGAPKGRDGYRLERLAEDLAAVVRAVSPGRAVHLVGHDWGSIQGWHAVTEPELAPLFASYTSISGPSLDHIGHWVRSRLRRPGPRRAGQLVKQLVSSWYIGFFQVPVLPKLVAPLVLGRAPLNARAADVRHGIELYRANVFTRRPQERRTSVPVQLVVPSRDPFVSAGLLEDTAQWCEAMWRRELPAGHWAPRTHPGAVARWVGEFVDHHEGGVPARGLRRARVGVPKRRFEGQLVLITGAGSGIGRASALAFAKEGADVIAADIDGSTAQRTATEVAEHGGEAFAYRLDVTDSVGVQALADRVRAEHGVPDVVMANAGIGVSGPFLETSEADWRAVVDVNLWGVIHTLRAFAPQLVERGEGGQLVVTASTASYAPSRTLPAYTTTKAAVLMLAQSLRGELAGRGIGVSAICPGFVHTNITNTTRFVGVDQVTEQQLRQTATRLYRRRGFTPDRVALAVLDAVQRNRAVVPVTTEAKALHALSRLSPTLLRAFSRVDLTPR